MTTTEVATTEQKQPTLAQLIERQKPEIARALPRHLNPDRMARIATTTLRQTPLLARCTPESFLGALMSAAQLGLEPGPLGEAYLVPFRDGKSGNYIVQFIPGYKGLIKLAWQSGQLADIWAEVVYSNDEFDYTLGLNRNLVHKPAKSARGEAIYVYAVAKLKDGGSPFVVLSLEEVESIRSRSKASKNGPWVTDWAAMARKTAVKQLSKWLPMSSEFASAVALDGSVRTDVGAQLVDVTPVDIDDAQPAIDAPAEDAETGQTSEPTPERPEVEMITADQSKKLHTLLTKEGLGGNTKEQRAAKLDWLAQAVSRPVTSSDELTKAEASNVIDLLEQAQQQTDETQRRLEEVHGDKASQA